MKRSPNRWTASRWALLRGVPGRLLLVLSLLGLAAAVDERAGAGPWPAWRGPAGTGVSPERDLPVEWDSETNIQWRVDLPEPGNSTPVIHGDRIFLTQPLSSRRERALFCLNREDGTLLWREGVRYPLPEETHDANPYCSASPVTDGDHVFAYFGSAGVVCYTVDGEEVWHRELGTQEHIWGYASSPVLYQDLCVVYHGPGEEAALIALDQATGETVWRYDVPERETGDRLDGFEGNEDGVVGSFSTPLLLERNGKAELIMSFPQELRSFHPRSGETFWAMEGLNPLVYTSPVYGEGIVVSMGGFFGATLAVRLEREPTTAGVEKAWHREAVRKNRLGSGVVRDGYFFVVNMPGIAQCLDLETGRVIWEERLPKEGAKGSSWSSMVLAGDKIYLPNQSGDTIVLKAEPEFEVVSVNPVGEPTNSSVAISEGEIFLRTHEGLWCIGRER